jgi:hypothetical protein
MRQLAKLVLASLVAVATTTSVFAGESEVTAVEVRAESAGTYSFSVTLRHADTGWDHYADRWQVLTMDGDVLATRTLFHPHVNEQPFTRSLGGVAVPAGTTAVRVRSHDSVHEYGGPELVVDLASGKTMPWTGGAR